MAASTPDDRPGLWTRCLGLVQGHPLVVCSFVVVGLLLGTVVAATRPHSYEADSRLLVGSFEAPASLIPAYVLTSQNVAGDYARVALTSSVIDPLAANLGMSSNELRADVTVTAIPESAVIRVVGRGADGAQAARIADAMTAAIVGEVDSLNEGGNGERILALHEQAAAALANAQIAQDAADRALAAGTTGGVSAQALEDLRTSAANARVATDQAQLQVDGYTRAFQLEQERTSTSSRLRSLGPPDVQESSMLLPQAGTVLLFAALALVLGLVVAARLDRRASGQGEPGHDGADLQVDRDLAGASASGSGDPGATEEPAGEPEEEVARPRSRRAPLTTDPSERPIGDRS